MATPFCPENSFSLPTPLTPKLVALGLDSETAATLSNVFISAALSLKNVYETEYARVCDSIMATGKCCGHDSKQIRSKLLIVTVGRYTQALSKWAEEALERAQTYLMRRDRKVIPEPKAKDVNTPSKPGLSSPVGKATVVAVRTIPPHQTELISYGTHPQASTPFATTSPAHAFPQPYPPLVWPEPVSFVIHIPRRKMSSNHQPSVASDSDLEACIAALSRLSLGPPSPQSRNSRKPSKTGSKPRSRNHVASTPKLTPRLSPSCPRLVSPIVDTSVAVSHKNHSKCTPRPPSTNIPHTQNIDVPLPNRRKVSPMPYRRPAMRQSTSPDFPSSFSRNIRRTPSLVSDNGSEASSPSTPPDFPSMPMPPSTLVYKGSFPESASPLELLFVPHSESGWQEIDFGGNIYG